MLQWIRKKRKAGAFIIIFALMLTLLWPVQLGIELDSVNVPMVQKTMKNALIAATKSAAQQVDQVQFHSGNFIIDPGKASTVFGQIMQGNLQVDSATWKPQSGSRLPSPLNVKVYLYNSWVPGQIPGPNSTLLNTGAGSPSDPRFPPLKDLGIPSVNKPTILAYASTTYKSFWGKDVVIEEFAAAQLNYAFNGVPTSPVPIITSVKFSGTPYDPTITITGTGFGGVSTPYTGGLDFLNILDTTRSWQMGVPTNSVQLNLSKWTNTEIVTKPTSTYGSKFGSEDWIFMPGDQVTVSLTSPQTGKGTTYNTAVDLPLQASISPSAPQIMQTSYNGNYSTYMVTVPFAYTHYNAAESFSAVAVDAFGNPTVSKTLPAQWTGSDSLSSSVSYSLNGQTYTILEKDSKGRVLATSTPIKLALPAPISYSIDFNAAAQGNTNDIAFSATTNNTLDGAGHTQVFLGIYDQTNGTWLTSTGTGTSASATVNVSTKRTFTAYVMTTDRNSGTAIATSRTITVTPGYTYSYQVQTGTTTEYRWEQTGGGYNENYQSWEIVNPAHQASYQSYDLISAAHWASYQSWDQTGGGYWSSYQSYEETSPGYYSTSYYGWCEGYGVDDNTWYSHSPPCDFSSHYVTYSTQTWNPPTYGWVTHSYWVDPTYGWVTHYYWVGDQYGWVTHYYWVADQWGYVTRTRWVPPVYGWVAHTVPVFTTYYAWQPAVIN